ncbi:hypothetical protein ACGCUQ_08380 (plasmid) [Eubacteriales bacterium KG127]
MNNLIEKMKTDKKILIIIGIIIFIIVGMLGAYAIYKSENKADTKVVTSSEIKDKKVKAEKKLDKAKKSEEAAEKELEEAKKSGDKDKIAKAEKKLSQAKADVKTGKARVSTVAREEKTVSNSSSSTSKPSKGGESKPSVTPSKPAEPSTPPAPKPPEKKGHYEKRQVAEKAIYEEQTFLRLFYMGNFVKEIRIDQMTFEERDALTDQAVLDQQSWSFQTRKVQTGTEPIYEDVWVED